MDDNKINLPSSSLLESQRETDLFVYFYATADSFPFEREIQTRKRQALYIIPLSSALARWDEL